MVGYLSWSTPPGTQGFSMVLSGLYFVLRPILECAFGRGKLIRQKAGGWIFGRVYDPATECSMQCPFRKEVFRFDIGKGYRENVAQGLLVQ